MEPPIKGTPNIIPLIDLSKMMLCLISLPNRGYHTYVKSSFLGVLYFDVLLYSFFLYSKWDNFFVQENT